MNKYFIFIAAISTGLAASDQQIQFDSILSESSRLIPASQEKTKVAYAAELTFAEKAGLTEAAKASRQAKSLTTEIFTILSEPGDADTDTREILSLVHQRANLDAPITVTHSGNRSEPMTVLTKSMLNNDPNRVQLLLDSKASAESAANEALFNVFERANPAMLRTVLRLMKDRIYVLPSNALQSIKIKSPLNFALDSTNKNEKELRESFEILIGQAKINPFAPCQLGHKTTKPCNLCFALANRQHPGLNSTQRIFLQVIEQEKKDNKRA